MLRLTREVRITLPVSGEELDQPVANSWGGWPAPRLTAPSMALQCTIAGRVDPVSGYLFNIADVDRAIRDVVLPQIVRAIRPEWTFETFIRFAWTCTGEAVASLGPLHRLVLRPTPQICFSINAENPDMVELTRQFEFSASHRLHNNDLSDEENRRLFGKCNNPHGHGHNYLVDVTVEGAIVDVNRLDERVRRLVIERLDHRYLNVEIEEFRETNPSVENIAAVIWDWLTRDPGTASLRNVRVYETPKTWADYRKE